MSEWKPFETAPKDGTPILVYSRGIVDLMTREVLHEPEMVVVRWAEEPWEQVGGYWALIQSGSYAWDDEAHFATATHWRPLPTPPDVQPLETDPPYCRVAERTEGQWVTITREEFIKEFGEEP